MKYHGASFAKRWFAERTTTIWTPLILTALLFVPLDALHAADASPQAKRPNVLWFVVDDMSANFTCYGETMIQTPHVDRLAREGTRFANAFVTAPVCSPCRSALITGMYQTDLQRIKYHTGGNAPLQTPKGRIKIDPRDSA